MLDTLNPVLGFPQVGLFLPFLPLSATLPREFRLGLIWVPTACVRNASIIVWVTHHFVSFIYWHHSWLSHRPLPRFPLDPAGLEQDKDPRARAFHGSARDSSKGSMGAKHSNVCQSCWDWLSFVTRGATPHVVFNAEHRSNASWHTLLTAIRKEPASKIVDGSSARTRVMVSSPHPLLSPLKECSGSAWGDSDMEGPSNRIRVLRDQAITGNEWIGLFGGWYNAKALSLISLLIGS